MEKKHWSKTEINTLIARYTENPILWNKSSADYRNLVKKRIIQKKIAAELNTTIVEVGRKIRILRAQWLKEHKNMKNYAEEFGSVNLYYSKWTWFNPLKAVFGYAEHNSEFTDNNTNISSEKDQIDDVIDQNHDDTYLHIKDDSIYADDIENSSILTGFDGSKDDDYLNYDNSSDVSIDEYQIFGNYVANELRSMHCAKNVQELKKMIHQNIVRCIEEDEKEYFSK